MFYVYAIHDEQTGCFKIGRCNGSPEYRLKQLQVGNPSRLSVWSYLTFSTHGEAVKAEAAIHWILRAFRAHGEWFKPTATVAEYVTDQMRLT